MTVWQWVAAVIGGVFAVILALAVFDHLVACCDRRREVKFDAELRRIARAHKANMEGKR